MTQRSSSRSIVRSAVGSRGRRLTIAVTVFFAVAASGAALAQVVTSSHHSTISSAPPAATVTAPPATGHQAAPVAAPTSVPADLRSAFGVFNRAQRPDDAPEAALSDQLTEALPGPAVTLARRVNGSDGRTYYVVPASNGLVCIASTGGGACGPADVAARSGLVETDICVAGLPGQIRVVGLVPDGVDNVQITTAGGSSVPAAVHDNLYAALIARSDPPTGIRWQHGSGAPVSETVVLPSDASQSC